MDSCFVYWFIFPYYCYLYWCSDHSRLGSRSPFKLVTLLFCHGPSFFEYLVTFCHNMMFQVHLVFGLPHPNHLSTSGDIQPWCTSFPIWNQSVVPCPVLTVASWPSYRFLRKQVRWSGIPISWRIFQFVVIHTTYAVSIRSVTQSCPTLCHPMDYRVHGILQAKITGLGSLSLLQGIFPTQGSKPGLPHCRQILYQLNCKRSPRILECQGAIDI